MSSIYSESSDTGGTDQAVTACDPSFAAFLRQFDHDLRTPLGTMVAAVDLLRHEPPGSQTHEESIAVLERQIARMHALAQTLTQALREFSPQRIDPRGP